MGKVLVFGTFDLLHPGHEFVLNEAKKRGELHVVVARDVNVEKIKGKKPSQNEEERIKAIRDKFPDSYPRLGDPEDFLIPVRDVHPDRILLGYDQKLPHGITEADFACTVERLPAFEPEKWKSSIQRKKI